MKRERNQVLQPWVCVVERRLFPDVFRIYQGFAVNDAVCLFSRFEVYLVLAVLSLLT